jgi:hypothetical protein
MISRAQRAEKHSGPQCGACELGRSRASSPQRLAALQAEVQLCVRRRPSFLHVGMIKTRCVYATVQRETVVAVAAWCSDPLCSLTPERAYARARARF